MKKLLLLNTIKKLLLLLMAVPMIGMGQSHPDSSSVSTEVNIEFQQRLIKLLMNMGKELNSENHKDYPVPYWNKIIQERGESMKLYSEMMDKSILEVRDSWLESHKNEYHTRFKDYNNKKQEEEILLRIERYGFIYDILEKYDKEIENLHKEFLIKRSVDIYDWDLVSAYASLYGCIKYAESIGVRKSKIRKAYSKYNK